MIRETPAAYQAGRQSQEKEQGSYTVEDYDNLPDEKRMELIDGVLYDMASPTSIHQALLWQIFKQISEHIEKKKGKCIPLFAPLDVQLDCDEKTMVQPDIIIVYDREKVKSRKIFGAPDFIVEILSSSTRQKDMFIKLSKYAAAGVREYWMVDPDRKKVVVHDFANENISVYGFDYEVPVGIFTRECMVDFKKIEENIRFLYDNR